MASLSHADPVLVDEPTADPTPSLFESARDVRFENHIAVCGLSDAVRRFDPASKGVEAAARFFDGVLDNLGKPYSHADARVFEGGSSLDDDRDVGAASLFVLPDDALVFVGCDPTSTRRTFPLFAFVVERGAPVPTPSTAREALDLLKPGDVRRALDDREAVARHGEWFLVPTDMVPVGRTWRPGKRGASPLGNHVPAEFGFAVSEAEFVARFHDAVPDAPSSLKSVDEILAAVQRWDASRLDRPGFELVQDLAGVVLVRGTVRHRERDHFNLDAGLRWRKAVTHDVDVYTAGRLDEEFVVRLD